MKQHLQHPLHRGSARKAAASFAGLLLLAACASSPPMEWSKAGTSTAQLQADGKDCRAIASWQAFDESNHSGPIYPPLKYTQFIVVGGDNDGALNSTYALRGAREAELADYCMQQRGYKLVPKG